MMQTPFLETDLGGLDGNDQQHPLQTHTLPQYCTHRLMTSSCITAFV
jgi:hypothetical protein